MMSKVKSGRSRGRPRKNLLEDPDRYPIAMAMAFRDVFGVSERKAFDLVVGLFLGEEAGSADKSNSDESDSLMLITYKLKIEPGAPATIGGRASTLRQKANQGERSPEEGAWLAVMATSFALVLSAKDYDKCSHRLRELAASIDESVFAEAVLMPMLWQKFNGPIFPRG